MVGDDELNALLEGFSSNVLGQVVSQKDLLDGLGGTLKGLNQQSNIVPGLT
jgi:hypothetical protein